MPAADILVPAPFPAAVLDRLARAGTVHRLWEAADPEALLRDVGPRIRAMTANTLAGRIGPELLDRLPALEIIANFGVGYDNIDIAAAVARGVVVTNTPGVLDDEVADFAVGLLLATLRQIPQADRFVRAGAWEEGPFPLSPTLRGRRIGIVGLGAIGKAVARRLAGFDVAIAWHGRTPQDTPWQYHPTLPGLAEAVDTLIVIVPGTPATAGMIDAEVLAALGPEGVLINVARGSVVDQPALIAALTDGTILAAGLDVFAAEPHVPAELLALPQVVLQPHIGSASAHTRAAMGAHMVANVEAWLDGAPPLTPVPECRGLLEEKK